MSDIILKKANEVLNQLRPFLNDDGGDMEIVEISEDKTVVVKLLGACSECSMSHMTMKIGLEEALKKAVPEIKGVIAINQ